jgi:hypothetical protein
MLIIMQGHLATLPYGEDLTPEMDGVTQPESGKGLLVCRIAARMTLHGLRLDGEHPGDE